MRVAPADARVLHSVVEGAAGVVEHLTHLDAAGDERVAGGVDVVHGEDQAVRRARLADVIPLPKMIEASELCGVICTPRKSPAAMSMSSRHPRFS